MLCEAIGAMVHDDLPRYEKLLHEAMEDGNLPVALRVGGLVELMRKVDGDYQAFIEGRADPPVPDGSG